MGGHAQADGSEPGGDHSSDPAASRSGTTSVSGPGQCCCAKAERFVRELADALRRRQIGHVDDQRVEAGRPLAS